MGETLVKLNSQLQTVEDELRRLNQSTRLKKEDGDESLT
ncbi:MAG: hypothetical protein CM15mP1_3750 [Methanobacteriota archaeon]|nr:MAG: hypothetical protein CM15mP1_3750 [Euryarchaeota archaeon]